MGRAVLFCDFLSLEDARCAMAAGRPEILASIVRDFKRTFPDISFELRLDRLVINAQAIALAGKETVLLYGGLALHPQMGPDALTFCILHEVGHHRANGNRLPCDASLACECAADYWASTSGANVLQAMSGRVFEMKKAIVEIARVTEGREEFEKSCPELKDSRCWRQCFSLRKQALINPPKSQPRGSCVQ